MGLSSDSSPDVIRNNANTMIARMTSEGKPDMAIFLENVKQRLLTEKIEEDSDDDEENVERQRIK